MEEIKTAAIGGSFRKMGVNDRAGSVGSLQQEVWIVTIGDGQGIRYGYYDGNT